MVVFLAGIVFRKSAKCDFVARNIFPKSWKYNFGDGKAFPESGKAIPDCETYPQSCGMLAQNAKPFRRNEKSNRKMRRMLFFEKIAEFAIILELNGYSGCMEIG